LRTSDSIPVASVAHADDVDSKRFIATIILEIDHGISRIDLRCGARLMYICMDNWTYKVLLYY